MAKYGHNNCDMVEKYKDFGGIRIEDMVIVGKNKCEVLYSSTKKFIVLD